MRPWYVATILVVGFLSTSGAAPPSALAQPLKSPPAFKPAGKPTAKPAPPPPVPPATTSPVRPEAKEAHNKALADLQKGDAASLNAAYKGFLEAWRLQGLPHIPRIAANLGRAELKLKKYRDAAEHLAFFLREEKEPTEADKQELGRQLAEAKAHVGTIKVEVIQAGLKKAGAQVLIDGAVVGTSPIDHDLYVEPGNRKVEATWSGLAGVQEVEPAAGSSLKVTLLLVQPQAAGTGGRSRVPGFLMIGGGAAAIAAGLVVMGGYLSNMQEAQKIHENITGTTDNARCPSNPQCVRLESVTKNGDVMRVAFPFVLAGGAALAAGGAAYLLWPQKAQPPAGDVKVGFAASPDGWAAGVSGSF